MATIHGHEGDLDAVRVFAEVVKTGGFTAASKALGLPKSTVSRRVSALEERLGTRLLQRTTRRVSLTDVGEVYYARAARALEELREAEAALSDLQDAPRGVLRLSAPVDIGQDMLVAVIAAYRREYPEVSLVVELENRRVDIVAEGYDLAIRASAQLDDSSLVARKLITAEMRLFASAEYLAKHGTPKRPEALREHELLLLGAPRLHARLGLHRGEERTDVEISGWLSSTDIGFLRRAMADGLGIASLPTFACSRDVAHGSVVRVLPEHHAGLASLYAVYPSARFLAPKVRAFVELAARQLGALATAAEGAPRGAV
jgi:DNA-binding transcriptional LysR family regulator